MPFSPDRVVELVARQRAEVAQQHDRRAGRGRRSRRAASCGSADGGRCRSRRRRPGARRAASSRSSSVERGRVAHLDDLGVAHQLAGPLDGADADAQQGEAEGDAERDVGGAVAARWSSGSSPIVEGEVGDARTAWRRGSTRPNSVATWRSARFSAFGSTSVGRGQVLGQAGVGDRVAGRSRSAVPSSWPCRGVRVVASRLAPFFERAECEAIQTAKPTRPPMPTSQANRPSRHGAEASPGRSRRSSGSPRCSSGRR